MSARIVNAKITGAYLGGWDHSVPGKGDILTTMIDLDMNGSGIGLGGYALTPVGLDKMIRGTLSALCLSSWEKLPGTLCRVELEGWNGPVIAIGHIMEDRWFHVREEMADE